jgi:putative CocE/NonD family hydrolase
VSIALLQGVAVEFDAPVPMRDGTVLRANVYRPEGTGRWPVLLNRTPYGKDLPAANNVIDAVQAARRGYVVVVQDTRGRFNSGGEYEPFRFEAEDGFDTIRWAAQQPYAEPAVGTYGASYHGFTQWSAALLQPPELKAMVPFITWAEPFNGMLIRGGAVELGVTAMWNLAQAMDTTIRRLRGDRAALGAAVRDLIAEYDRLGPAGYSELPLAEFPPHRRQGIDGLPGIVRQYLDQEATGPLRIAGKHHQVQAATYNIGGWYDIFLQDTINAYRAMHEAGRPNKLLIGPWAHVVQMNPVGELNFGFGAQPAFINLEMDFRALQLRWFDHWLKGVQNGVMEEPPVRIFVMGANTWRYEDSWPPAKAKERVLHLREGLLLSEEPPGAEAPEAFDYDPAEPVPTVGGALLMTPEFRPGPWDQRSVEVRPDVLTYTTEPLQRDLEVTGPVKVELWAASTAPSTDFVARLCDVYPDGRSMNITDGIVRAVNLKPGEPLKHDIDLWSTSNLFKTGHRLRLQVTSSCFPRWDRNPNTGHPVGADAELALARQTILHDREHPSRLLISVMEG